jgi:hypothetical protein
MSLRVWTKEEDSIVRHAWEAQSESVRAIDIAAAMLPHRTKAAISTRAALLGVSLNRRMFAPAPKKKSPVKTGDLNHIKARLIWTMESLSAELGIPRSHVADAIAVLVEQGFHEKSVSLEEMVTGIKLR